MLSKLLHHFIASDSLVTLEMPNSHRDKMLARIFHSSLLRKPRRPMDTALDLNLDSESMDTYSHRPSSAPALSHQPSQLPRHESDEISELEEYARKLLQSHSPRLAQRVTVSWNPRMRTSAGLADYQRYEVILNPALKKISAAEVDRTLRHELAHLLAHDRSGKKRITPHGLEWRQACSDLGIPNESRTHELPFVRRHQQRKFFYRCPCCHEGLSRVRKPRRKIACLACCRKYAGGKYEERFRFEVIEKL